MPIHSRYFPEWNLWVEYASGQLTLAQAIANKQGEIDSRLGNDASVVLVDLRSAMVDPSDARQWSIWMESEHPDYMVRAAYLVEEPRVTGLMLLVKQSFHSRRTEVFSDLPNALRWLGIDPATCRPEDLGIAP